MTPTLAPALRLPRRRGRERVDEELEFAQVAESHLDAVYRYVHGLVRDSHAAEDVTAAAFEKALRSWSSFDPRRAQALTWLCHIARNAAIDHWRREEHRRLGQAAYEARAPRAHCEVEEPGLGPELRRALLHLPRVEREVVALRILLDMSCEEAASVIGISTTACSTYLHRALGKLRERTARNA